MTGEDAQQVGVVQHTGCGRPEKYAVALESRVEDRLVEHIACEEKRRHLERAPNHVRTEAPAHVR